MEPPRKTPPKPFGKRGRAPPIITHAPEGLPGGPEGDSRRMRTGMIILGGFGAAALGLMVLADAIGSANCRKDNPEDYSAEPTHCSSGHSHFGGGGWGHAGTSVSFGGFGGHAGGGGE